MGDNSEFSSTQAEAQKKYRGSIYTSVECLPDEFVEGIKEIEDELGFPVLMLIQNTGDRWYDFISHEVYKQFFDQRNDFPKGESVALLLRSSGGDPSDAYKLANLFRKRYRGFTALIPDYAKSAATILALGSDRIVLGTYAELGPLDMQVPDEDRETYESALNHVQTLERLGAYSKTTLDETVMMLLYRTNKKISAVLPYAIEFTASIVRPLMENIDVVKYSEMSRLLKIGEEYAKRLLIPKYGKNMAAEISRKLVSNYPEHRFVIDVVEARAVGLKVDLPEGKISEGFSKLLPFIDKLTVLGSLQEVEKDGKDISKG